eukprot:3368942-Amphidinium_carterae.1
MQSFLPDREITRCYLVASERELAAKANVEKMSRVVLKTLHTTVCVPSEDGEKTETLHVFQDPQQSLRKLHVKVSVGCQLAYKKQDFDKQLWEGRALKMYESSILEPSCKESGPLHARLLGGAFIKGFSSLDSRR